MLVKDYMTPDPVTVRPESDFLAAIAILKAAKFHSLPVVSKDGQLVGIVTDKDLAAASPPTIAHMQHREPDFFGVHLRVEQVMNPDFVDIGPDVPLEEAALIMLQRRVDRLLITEQDKLVGIITYTDIFRRFVSILGGGSSAIRITVEVNNVPGELERLAGAIAGVGGNIISVATAAGSNSDRVALTMRIKEVEWSELRGALMACRGLEILHACGPEGLDLGD